MTGNVWQNNQTVSDWERESGFSESLSVEEGRNLQKTNPIIPVKIVINLYYFPLWKGMGRSESKKNRKDSFFYNKPFHLFHIVFSPAYGIWSLTKQNVPGTETTHQGMKTSKPYPANYLSGCIVLAMKASSCSISHPKPLP
jgi:hypothetical protein